jgi:HSP20 family protein
VTRELDGLPTRGAVLLSLSLVKGGVTMNLMPWRNKKKTGSSDISAPSLWRNGSLESFIDRFFRDPWSLDWPAQSEELFPFGPWAPPVDVTETEKEVRVRSEIPGVDPKDLSITVSGQILTISGEKSETNESKEEQHYRTERRFGSFHRSIQLPTAVDPDKVKAEYASGVLTVILERKEGAAVKRIPVHAK